MAQCYGWTGTDGLGKTARFIACANKPSWELNPIYGKNEPYYFPADNKANLAWFDYGAKPGSIVAINSDEELESWHNGSAYVGDCSLCLEIFVPRCEGEKETKIIISGQEYTFKGGIKTSCRGTILKIKNSGGTKSLTVPDCNSYEVVCGSQCPEGYMRCECDQYPGYCCIPCSEIRSGIAEITAYLRRLNNG